MRMLSTYIAFGAAALLVLLLHLGIYYGAPKTDWYEYFQRQRLNVSMLVNGFVATRMALEIGFILLVAPMVIQVFARQVAGEDLRGTLRLVLSRPISRRGLLNAKFLVCFCYCALLMGFLLTLSYGLGLGLYGAKDTMSIGSWDDFNGRRFSQQVQSEVKIESARLKKELEEKGEAMPSPEEVRMQVSNRLLVKHYGLTADQLPPRLFLAWILTTLSLLTIGSLAFLFSVINKHPIAAMALTLGTFFLVKILQELASAQNIIPIFRTLRPYLFTTAMDDFWRSAFSQQIDWALIRAKGAILLAYTLGFYAVAQLVFWRKDITS